MKDSPLSRRRKPKLKLICRFNGTFQQRPPSGMLRYTCGEARIISVDHNIGFSTLKARILELINKCLHFSLLYHLTGNSESTDQSPLVLIASDDDVRRMIDEYEKLEFQGKLCRLWIFVCSDFGFLSLLNKDNGFMKFRETEGLISSGSGVLCRKNCFGVNKNGAFLCEKGFVNQFSLTHLFGGHGGDNKVKKFVTNGDKVKSSENSLRKMVLKQQLLAKQSARVRRYRGGQGLTMEQSHQLETPSSDSGKNARDLLDLRYVPESLLSSGSRNHSFVGRSDRGNILDYKYNNTNFVKSENFANSVTLTASHSHPLNLKDGNTCLGLSNSMHSSSGKANENLGNSCGTSSCNSSQSIVVLPFPKADSLISCYDAKCESDSIELASLSNMNRENIMPSGGDSITIRSGLATTCCNQLVGGVCSARPSYGSSHDGIRNHRLGASDSRKMRISPYHFRNHRSILTDMGNLKNLKLGQSPWAGKIYPGPWYSSSISKQGKVMRSLNPTSSMPRSDFYHQQVEEEATTTEYILNSETCLFSQSYDSQEKLSHQDSIGVAQDGKQNPNEYHPSYYDPHPGMADESLPSLNSTQNSSARTTGLNSQTDLLTGPGNEQHEVSCKNLCQCLPEIGEGFSKRQTCNHALEGGIASSVDFTLQTLTLSSCEDVEPPTPSSDNDISQALLKPRSTALHLMDEENFSSGPQVQDLSEVASVSSFDKALKLQKDKDQEAGVQRDLESPTSIGEKEEIKKTHNGSKVNGGMPTELAAVCAHLPTRELQTIKNSDLEYIKELGSGTYGTVFYGKWKGSDVAIKKLKPSCFNGDGGAVEEDRLVADFWKEAHMLGQLHHPNIVALYGVVTDGPVTNLATVTEYMVNGSLKQVLRRKDRTIDRRKRVIIAMDAAFGMEYLHEKNIVHFDLKSHNFLVNMRDPQRPVCKIGDLGLSKIKRKTLVSGGVRGTIPWMAPELLNSKNMVTEKVDVYSFGIVMWELLTGEEPYANMRSHEIIAGIIKGTLQPETQSWCDPAWRSLMEKCWSLDPDARPSFSEIAKELRAMAAAMNIK